MLVHLEVVEEKSLLLLFLFVMVQRRQKGLNSASEWKTYRPCQDSPKELKVPFGLAKCKSIVSLLCNGDTLRGYGCSKLRASKCTILKDGGGVVLEEAVVVLDKWRDDCLPRHSARLHSVGQSHIIAPHIKLPFSQSNHATQDIARMDPDPHIHIGSCHLTNSSGEKNDPERWMMWLCPYWQQSANKSNLKHVLSFYGWICICHSKTFCAK